MILFLAVYPPFTSYIARWVYEALQQFLRYQSFSVLLHRNIENAAEHSGAVHNVWEVVEPFILRTSVQKALWSFGFCQLRARQSSTVKDLQKLMRGGTVVSKTRATPWEIYQNPEQ